MDIKTIAVFFNRNNLNDFFNYLVSPGLQEKILFLKIGVLVLSGFFLWLIIFVILRTNWVRYAFAEKLVEFFTYRPYGAKKITKEWAKILKRLETGNEGEYRLAISEAEDMFGETLRKLGYGAKTLEERMGQAAAILSNAEELREAHRIRNQALYDPAYKLDQDTTRKVVRIYEQALRDLEIF